MSELLGKQTGEHPPEPWQQFLAKLLPWPGGKFGHPFHQVYAAQSLSHFPIDAVALMERNREAVASQLATSIRLQGIDEEANVMLGLLVTLIQAGEITFADYARRVQNLFPQQCAGLDPALSHKLTAMLPQ
ncbi:MAG: hypothetical protein ACKVOE_03960 [Rickettsiales bacterium]